MRYDPKLSKVELIHGEYYRGRCRNATIARWDGHKQRFIHWRTKFGYKFLEEICHPEDEANFDVFVVESLCLHDEEIPLDNKSDL